MEGRKLFGGRKLVKEKKRPRAGDGPETKEQVGVERERDDLIWLLEPTRKRRQTVVESSPLPGALGAAWAFPAASVDASPRDRVPGVIYASRKCSRGCRHGTVRRGTVRQSTCTVQCPPPFLPGPGIPCTLPAPTPRLILCTTG